MFLRFSSETSKKNSSNAEAYNDFLLPLQVKTGLPEGNNCLILFFTGEKENEGILQDIRKKATTGRPCGGTTFIEKLEQRCGYRLRALTRGRPKTRDNKSLLFGIRVKLRFIFHVCHLNIVISGIWQAICDKWKEI